MKKHRLAHQLTPYLLFVTFCLLSFPSKADKRSGNPAHSGNPADLTKPADPADSTFKDWYFTPKGAFGRLPLSKPKYRSYVKIIHPSDNLVTIQKFNPAGILVTTFNARLANGQLNLLTATDRWGYTYDSMWFRPDGPGQFIVTEREKGQNPFLPCKSYVYTFKNDLLIDILGLADSIRPGTNKDGVAHYVYERYDDPARFGLVKSETFYNEIDIPVISRTAGCHKIIGEYDQQGRLLSRAVYDENERPATDQTGVFTTRFKYDHDDNETEADFFDVKGAPVVSTFGYSQVAREYKRGFLVKKTFYYDNTTIVRSTRLADSIAITEYKYDQDGNEIEAACFDRDGTPIDNAKGYHKTLSGWSSNGMLIRQGSFKVQYNPPHSQSTDPGFRYQRDDKGRLIGECYMDGVGQVVKNVIDGTFLTKLRLDDWGRVVSVSYWLDDSTKMTGSEGFHEKRMEYNADGQVIKALYVDQNDDPTTGSIGYSRELISYNDQGLVAERKYFDGGTPVQLSDQNSSPFHFHSIRYGYDFFNRLRSFDYYDSLGRPVNAALKLRDGQTINCQHVDIDYIQAPQLVQQTVRDSGNLAAPVVLDCSKGDCLPIAGRKPGNAPGATASHKQKSYHGHIRIDSLYAGQLTFLSQDSILLFLNDNETRLSQVGCAAIYRLAPINKYYQQDGAVTDFYLSNDSVAARLTYDRGALSGPCSFYYANGQLKERGDYQTNSKVGIWEYYYDNGQKEKTVRFNGQTPLLLDCYTENGQVLAQNGNGRFEGSVITNTPENPEECKIKGTVKDGLPDGEWSLYNQFFSTPTNKESFVAGQFKHGISYSLAGKKDYDNKYYSRFESVHPYEKIDHYGQQNYCMISGKRTKANANLKVPLFTDDFPELKAGFQQILKTNLYKDYSGWVFVDLKYDTSGHLSAKEVRLYQQNNEFRTAILDMLDHLTNPGQLIIDNQNTPYDKFFILLVSSNEVVIPEQILRDQRSVFHK